MNVFGSESNYQNNRKIHFTLSKVVLSPYLP